MKIFIPYPPKRVNWLFLVPLPSTKPAFPDFLGNFEQLTLWKEATLQSSITFVQIGLIFSPYIKNLDFIAFKVIWGFACSFVYSRLGFSSKIWWSNSQSLSEVPRIPWIYFSKDLLMQLPTTETRSEAFLELLVASAVEGIPLFSWQVCTETAQTPKLPPVPWSPRDIGV